MAYYLGMNTIDKILGNNVYLDVLPAYGRVYHSEEAARADWNNGKDWQIWRGPYCSNRDVAMLKEMGYTHIHLIWNITRASCTFVL